MALNQRYAHNATVSLTAPADLTSGQPLRIGAYAGVALADAKAGAKFTFQLIGSFDQTVEGAVAEGDLIYITPTGELTTTKTGNKAYGIANTAKANAAPGIVEVAPLGKTTA